MGAYSRDAKTGKYRVHMDRMETAVDTLAERILRLQGDGDYDDAKAFMNRYSQQGDDLKHDIIRINESNSNLCLMIEQ